MISRRRLENSSGYIVSVIHTIGGELMQRWRLMEKIILGDNSRHNRRKKKIDEITVDITDGKKNLKG